MHTHHQTYESESLAFGVIIGMLIAGIAWGAHVNTLRIRHDEERDLIDRQWEQVTARAFDSGMAAANRQNLLRHGVPSSPPPLSPPPSRSVPELHSSTAAAAPACPSLRRPISHPTHRDSAAVGIADTRREDAANVQED